MKLPKITPGIVGITTALGSTVCCVLPMLVVFLGLGSGAFMMTTMKYRPILYPLGVIGLGVAYYLYFREKRACDLKSCKMQGKRFNLFLLIASTFVMAIVTYVDFFLTTM